MVNPRRSGRRNPGEGEEIEEDGQNDPPPPPPAEPVPPVQQVPPVAPNAAAAAAQQFMQLLQQMMAGGGVPPAAAMPGAGGVPPPPPMAPPAAGAITFSMSPYGRILDPQGNKEDKRLWQDAMAPITPSFDGKREHLRAFMKLFQQRVKQMDCEAIFEIQLNAPGGPTANVFQHSGKMELTDMKAAALVRWAVDDWPKQASYLTGYCLLSSLSTSFHTKVTVRSTDYEITGRPDGPLLAKIIHQLVAPYSEFTVNHLCLRLQTIDPNEDGNELTAFHERYQALVDDLCSTEAGAGMCTDVIKRQALLQAYRKIPNEDMKQYLNSLRYSTAPQTAESLKEAVEELYIDWKEEERWDKPSTEQQIMTLEAKIESQGKKMKEMKKKSGSKKSRSREVKRTAKKDGRRSKPDSKRKSVEERTEENAWKFEAPSDADKDEIIKKDGKDWNWCVHHKKYVLAESRWGKHNSSTCNLNPKKKRTVTVNQVQVDESDDEDGSDSSSNEDEEVGDSDE